ncbi:hypothetical protein [Streptomyces sp. NPDC048172]|uniref:hypothetical protein n=1 Tax=Streptomyces sp. NPDC048172 TaxID=3365505 RepID=UPI00371F6A0D
MTPPDPTPDPTPAWTPADPGAVSWLAALTGDDGLTGFLAPPLPDVAWVLNAMYEHESGPGATTYEQRRAAQLAAGAERDIVGGIDFDAAGVMTGGDLGHAEHPGPGWRRLRWAELARRTGDPLVPEGLLPSHRCFPSARAGGSWPVGIQPPTEGSLDRETWQRLVALLTGWSPDGAATRCLAYYCPLIPGTGDFDRPHVRAGRLGDAQVLYDDTGVAFTPSNLWAEDRSWVVCTDHDLWATKVAGPAPLIAALLDDGEIEAVRLPWAR